MNVIICINLIGFVMRKLRVSLFGGLKVGCFVAYELRDKNYWRICRIWKHLHRAPQWLCCCFMCFYVSFVAKTNDSGKYAYTFWHLSAIFCIYLQLFVPFFPPSVWGFRFLYRVVNFFLVATIAASTTNRMIPAITSLVWCEWAALYHVTMNFNWRLRLILHPESMTSASFLWRHQFVIYCH